MVKSDCHRGFRGTWKSIASNKKYNGRKITVEPTGTFFAPYEVKDFGYLHYISGKATPPGELVDRNNRQLMKLI